jgi:hypothetical protein
MSAPEDPPRVGVAWDGERATAVLVGDGDRVLAHRVLPRAGAGPGALSELVGTLAGGRGPVDRVVLVTERPVAGLARPAGLPRVGTLRIGAPATTTVPPLTGWPAPLAAAVRGPVAVVRGGHRYDGRESVPLDIGAVRAFGEACRGEVGAVAVTGSNAHMDAAHEERAAGLLADLLGPAVPVLAGHQVGGAGLLERENTAVLGAALAPATLRFTEGAAAALAAAGTDADLYLVGGDGTVLPAAAAARHPLALCGATHAAARVGAGVLSGLDGFVVVDVGRRAVTVSAQTPDGPLTTGLFTQLAGVRTALPGYRSAQLDPAGPAGPLLRAAVRRVAGPPPTGPVPVVLVGPGADALGTPADGPDVLRPERPGLAAALGAAHARAAGSVDRIYFYDEGGREQCVAAARRTACELAVRRGADPRLLRVGEVREVAMTYVPVPCVRLRVTAVGPPLVTTAGVR